MFTDKTGTLTENEMHFRECSINGTKYREVNGKLVPEGMTDESPDGSTPQLVSCRLYSAFFNACTQLLLLPAYAIKEYEFMLFLTFRSVLFPLAD